MSEDVEIGTQIAYVTLSDLGGEDVNCEIENDVEEVEQSGKEVMELHKLEENSLVYNRCLKDLFLQILIKIFSTLVLFYITYLTEKLVVFYLFNSYKNLRYLKWLFTSRLKCYYHKSFIKLPFLYSLLQS